MRNLRHGGRILVDPARRTGMRSGLPRTGRELSRGHRRIARSPRDRHRGLPPGGRGGDDGRGVRQAHRSPRRMHGHPRAGGDQCRGRNPRRVPGFDAARPHHRPGRPRDAGPRSFPGDGLSPHVRRDGQVGGPDRRYGSNSGVREPSLPRGGIRTARTGGAGRARGRALGPRRRSRRASRRTRDPEGGDERRRCVRETPRGIRTADADRWRRGLVGRRRTQPRAVLRDTRRAGQRLIPLPGLHRQPPPELLRPCRHRDQPPGCGPFPAV